MIGDNPDMRCVGKDSIGGKALPGFGNATAPFDFSLYLLRTIIEDFGGEATCFGLRARAASAIEAFGVEDSDVLVWLRDQISGLADDGAISLEITDRAMHIARIEQAGAYRAGEIPWRH